MVTKQELKQINELLDLYAVKLVGILCKRVEVTEKLCMENKPSELIEIYPKLFKALIKELTYENFRMLKNEFLVSFIPTVVYRGNK